MTPIGSLKRNDVPAAILWIQERESVVTPEKMKVLLMLQDDPDVLLSAIAMQVSHGTMKPVRSPKA